MLELMIALFLVGTFALPLARLPMHAMHEEFKSAYRMQAQRLADLRFAEFKEKIYRQEIPWKDIIKTREEKFKLPNEDVEVSFEPLGKRKFLIEKTLHSVGKKTKEGEEYRLATLRVKISPQEIKFKLFRTKKGRVRSRVYTYQTLICKSAVPAAQLATPEATVPTTQIPSG